MSGRTLMRRRRNSLLLKLELQVVSSEPLLRGLSFRTALAMRNLFSRSNNRFLVAPLLGMTFSKEDRRNHAQETYC